MGLRPYFRICLKKCQTGNHKELSQMDSALSFIDGALISHFLGISEHSRFDNIPYTTLGYSTGGPNNMAYEVYNDTAVRKDPTSENTTAFTYSQQAAVITDEAQHGGVDIAVYAIGNFMNYKLSPCTKKVSFLKLGIIHFSSFLRSARSSLPLNS